MNSWMRRTASVLLAGAALAGASEGNADERERADYARMQRAILMQLHRMQPQPTAARRAAMCPPGCSAAARDRHVVTSRLRLRQDGGGYYDTGAGRIWVPGDRVAAANAMRANIRPGTSGADRQFWLRQADRILRGQNHPRPSTHQPKRSLAL